jgi:hypothetical protein
VYIYSQCNKCYGSPHSNVKIFLAILDEIISKVMKSLLLLNNLLNMVACPTRVTKSLIEAMIRNKIFYHTPAEVVELGYLDNFAQVMNVGVKCPLCSFSESCKKSLL